MQSKTYSKKHQFISNTIIGLQHPVDRFMYNLVHSEYYELIMYHWILRLYYKGKSSELAIQILYRVRHYYLIRGNYFMKI